MGSKPALETITDCSVVKAKVEKPPRAMTPLASLWTSKVAKEAAAPAKKAENEAARKGAFRRNSLGTLGQPPAAQVQLDRQLQLAEAIRQRQQREGLVVVPWETISFTQTTLAKGAFGTVALATLNELGGLPCAVKIADVLSGDGLQEALALLNEGSMKNMNHPNIVKTLGIAFDAPAKIGLIMELMTCSLHELMHGHALRGLRRHVSWADSLLAIVTDVTSGMAYLHYHNVIHRDLKPLNVLMTDGWKAKVADFGEVKLIKGEGDAGVRAAVSTASGVPDETRFRSDFGKSGGVRIHGTPSYVSPEAASVDIPTAPRVGKPTDVWSFGCLLAHCAARAPPYTDHKVASVQEVIQQLRDGRAQPLSMVVEGVNMPALLVEIARDCTRIVPEERPTFSQLSRRLSAPSLVRTICFERWLVVEDEEDSLEVRRPVVRLSVPTPSMEEPSAVVGSASGGDRLASGSVASSAKPKSMQASYRNQLAKRDAEVQACIIS